MCKTCGCSSRSRGFGNIERFIEPCILLLLTKKPSHGYELREDLIIHCGHNVDIGNLYRTLRKMEAKGWVKSDWHQKKGTPDRRIYITTPEGKLALGEAITSLKQTDMLLQRLFAGYHKVFANL